MNVIAITPNPNHIALKTELRDYYRQLRRNMSDHDREVAAQKVSKAFFSIFSNPKASQVLAGYIGINNELEISSLLRRAESIGYEIALPAVIAKGEALRFRLCGAAPRIKPNKIYASIPEPLDIYPLVTPNIVIAPLLACDKKGTRLGYGGGFYDRTLVELRRNNPDLIALGLCYDKQVADQELPSDEHDQKLNMIITERNIHIISF